MSSGQFRRPVLEPGVASWVIAHEAVLEVARERAVLERREGTSLLLAFRERVHRHLGYGAFAEYTDRHLGYCHRTTTDKLRTAEALEHLPELARAQRDGRLHASAVRELARVATTETETAWIESARGLRVREVERLVSGRARGDHPNTPPRPELEKHVLRFEVSGETLAVFRDATQRLNEACGEKLDDDSVLLLLARAALSWRPPAPVSADAEQPGVGEPGAAELDGTEPSAAEPGAAGRGAANSDPDAPRLDPRAVEALGRANYQVTIVVCDHCKRAYQPAGADLVAIDAASLAAACCDAQHVDLTHGRETHGRETHGRETRGNETRGNETHGCEAHANVARGCEVVPNETHASVAHANETHGCDTHANVAHGREANANVARGCEVVPNETHASVAHANETHASVAHANETHASVAHANETHASVAHANETHASVAHANETHGCDTHANVAHGREANANVARGCEVERNEIHASVAHGCETHGCEERAPRAPRATQSVPPAIRRQVLLRDRRRCQVPGCRNTLALDVHHIVPRAEGGTHHAHNQIVICTVHHRGIHLGQLLVSGRAPDHVVFQHPDGTPYGGDVSAQRSDICEKVYRGLCWLGFTSKQARRALAECRRDGDVGTDAQAVLRKALARLR